MVKSNLMEDSTATRSVCVCLCVWVCVLMEMVENHRLTTICCHFYLFVVFSIPFYRSHYISTVYAGRLMVPRKSGLIVNISDLGGQSYMLSVAYGVGKAAVRFLLQWYV